MFMFVGLSMLVLIVYMYFFPPQSPPPPAEEISRQVGQADVAAADKASSTAITAIDPVSAPAVNLPERKINLETDLFSIQLSTKGGYLNSMTLNDHDYSVKFRKPLYRYLLELFSPSEDTEPVYTPGKPVNMVNPDMKKEVKPFYLALGENVPTVTYESKGVVKGENGKSKTLTFVGTAGNGLTVERQYTVTDGSYVIHSRIKILNGTSNVQSIDLSVMLGSVNEVVPENERVLPKLGITYFDEGKETFEGEDLGSKPKVVPSFDWAGVMSLYFISTAKKPAKEWSATFDHVEEDFFGRPYQSPLMSLNKSSTIMQPNGSYEFDTEFYMGPKQTTYMDEFDRNLVETLGMHVKILALPMLKALRWFHEYTGNWGISIILLTLCVRILILPIAYKGIKSMKKMGKLTPKIKKLKEKYKDNKEKLNQEIMTMYKKNKVNPVGGCLPMLLQIPIFLALYSALLPAIELRHQPFFLWVYDLSQPDYLMILPVLCGLSMFLQQKLTPSMATMDPMQEKIMKFFPVMLSLFFVISPSGLVLYWTVSGGISILQQLFFNNRFKNI